MKQIKIINEETNSSDKIKKYQRKRIKDNVQEINKQKIRNYNNGRITLNSKIHIKNK